MQLNRLKGKDSKELLREASRSNRKLIDRATGMEASKESLMQLLTSAMHVLIAGEQK